MRSHGGYSCGRHWHDRTTAVGAPTPTPSPTSLPPHPNPRPSAAAARECASPAAMAPACPTSARASTSAGCLKSESPPWPRRPDAPQPHE
eukprot:scaffold86255_cov31-Tisochrysis_lutea.AAC.3